MTFNVSFSQEFAKTFAGLSVADQKKIDDFIGIFLAHGLGSFSHYPGKIAPSWSGPATRTDAAYARANELWHYHVGIPRFKPSVSGKYATSDWLLHFQWPKCGSDIKIVDLLPHNSSSRGFNLPAPQALP